MKNPLDNMMGNPLQAIDKLVEQARELERESKLSNTDWVEEQYDEGEEPTDHYEETMNEVEYANSDLTR